MILRGMPREKRTVQSFLMAWDKASASIQCGDRLTLSWEKNNENEKLRRPRACCAISGYLDHPTIRTISARAVATRSQGPHTGVALKMPAVAADMVSPAMWSEVNTIGGLKRRLRNILLERLYSPLQA